MKKVIFTEIAAVLVLALIMFCLLHEKEVKDVSLELVEQTITENFTLDGMEKAGDMRLKRAFGLSSEEYAEVLYYTPDNTMSVNELLVVKLQDESQLDTVKAAVDSRLETQKTNFNNYGTDQTELLNNAKFLSEGNYVVFIVGKDALEELSAIRKVWEG